jgi:hypothetical protein
VKTATLIRKLDGFRGDARLYKLSEPVAFGYDDAGATDHVVVSAVQSVLPTPSAVFFRDLDSGPETYVFPATADGEVLSWGELEGSYRGGTDHERALRGAGYEVQP